jgi:hypothetical protein
VLFGAEAVKEGFGYVECFPDGYKYVRGYDIVTCRDII